LERSLNQKVCQDGDHFGDKVAAAKTLKNLLLCEESLSIRILQVKLSLMVGVQLPKVIITSNNEGK
jgi:hypothetical protein